MRNNFKTLRKKFIRNIILRPCGRYPRDLTNEGLHPSLINKDNNPLNIKISQ